jgi:hypothetical protein
VQQRLRQQEAAMNKLAKQQIDKTLTGLNPPDSDYWASQDDPHDAWSIELLEIAAKTRPPTSKIGGLPEAESQRIIRPTHRPQPKKKVRHKAA